jgi:hypothetical protein
VARLAQLPPLDYDKVREKVAEAMGVRVSTLDGAVRNARGDGADVAKKGRPIELYVPEPWDRPVDGVRVLDSILACVQMHMHISEADAIATTLWIAHTHMFDAFRHTPRHISTAPDAECGKTVLMSHMIGNMIPKPMHVELMKAPPFFRLTEDHRPTWLIDEVDVFIRDDSDLLAALNSGWEPHGAVARCVGDDNEVRLFSTHAPVAMAGIDLHKKLPSTTLGRSIVVMLERASEGEISERHMYEAKKHKTRLRNLGRKLARWIGENRQLISKIDPTLPPGVKNRLADKWTPCWPSPRQSGGIGPNEQGPRYLDRPTYPSPPERCSC